VWARVADAAEAAALADGARLLPALAVPVVLQGPLESLPALIAAREGEPVRFDRILARNVLGRAEDKAVRIALLASLLAPGGRLLLAEQVPRLGERLLAGLDWRGLAPEVAARAVAAEEAVYADPADPLVNWGAEELATWCREAGLRVVEREIMRRPVEFPVGPALLRRWFGEGAAAGGAGRKGRKRSPPGEETVDAPGRLAALLGKDAPAVRAYLERTLAGGTVRRTTAVALLAAERTD
jgi:putative ATPase